MSDVREADWAEDEAASIVDRWHTASGVDMPYPATLERLMAAALREAEARGAAAAAETLQAMAREAYGNFERLKGVDGQKNMARKQHWLSIELSNAAAAIRSRSQA